MDGVCGGQWHRAGAVRHRRASGAVAFPCQIWTCAWLSQTNSADDSAGFRAPAHRLAGSSRL
jgi:hypothetical protein